MDRETQMRLAVAIEDSILPEHLQTALVAAGFTTLLQAYESLDLAILVGDAVAKDVLEFINRELGP